LTTSTLLEVNQIIKNDNLQIVSILENKMKYKNQEFCEFILPQQLNLILQNPFIYTAYTIDQITLIYSYKHRLQFFYPNQYWKQIQKFTKPKSFLWLAIYNEGLDELIKTTQGLTIEILFKDATKTMLKITKSQSTKESWIKKLKKSPAIGIGDSTSDYDFIKHCEIKVAMANGEEELKKRCTFHTKKTNNEDGALDFLIDYLAHQPS
ncbi:MAG: HAD family hydrolase, partial [Anaeroplasmataceae bacterium]|nr:HAD family hydrolase [Anaeroplasmataceae bacterium]